MSSNAREPRNGVSFGPFRIFPAERLLERDGVVVPVGSRAFDLLAALVEKSGDVVGKDELIARAWPNLIVDESSLRFHIAGLRKALGDGQSGARYIANVPGRGYCLVAPAIPFDAAPPAAAPPLEVVRPVQGLPHRLTRMIGRDETVRRIGDLLARKRFLTIHGPGGIGKTTVAVAVAHAHLDAVDGAVYFLDLAPLADPALVVDALASVLGVMPQAVDPVPAIIDFLHGRRALIVLDSCEHVVGAAATLAERIHQEAPGVALLATSRERLRVEGEHVVELPPLDRPPDSGALSIGQVLNFAAAHLFADRAAAGGYGAELTDADAATVTEVCRKLDGIALAIELVASRVAAHGLHETAALLDGRLRLLWQGRRTALPRHQTLNAALDWSYDLISEVERTVLRRLSIFVGPFPLSAVQSVAPDDRLEDVLVVEALEGLVAKSLVSVGQQAAASQYRLLDTTRAYANGKLAESGELNGIAKRHAAYVRDALRDIAAASSGGGLGASKDAPSILGDVHAALRWSFAAQGEAALAASLAAAAVTLFAGLSLLNECRRWSEAALSVIDDANRDTETELQLQAALGHALMFTDGNGDRTRAALERALEIAERLGDRPGQFRLLSRLHMYYRRRGELSLLEPVARRMETLAARIGHPAGVAAAHNLLGVSHHLTGDLPAARAHLEAVLHLAEFRRVVPGHFAFHRNPSIALARNLWLQGYPDQAVAAAKPLATQTATADLVTYCIGLIWGASVFQWVGDWDMFEALGERLIASAASHSLKPYEAVGLAMRGERLIQAGQLDGGIGLLQTAVAALRADHYELYTSGFGGSLAMALATRGLVADAHAVIDETLARVLLHGGSFELPELLRIRGEVQLRLGDVTGAEASFREAISVADRQGALSWRLRACTSLARLCRGGDGARGARDALAETHARFTEGFTSADLEAAQTLLAELAAADGGE
ncbi:winged helix-turn-helix domain-containing protein [Azospirillum sp. TSO35-2]|uniref:ATP-binding protein n=1 Tax=Azospirillum sp. TSO35-2 TaxID=716796 RepID=UPI000D611668|nr:winged helix-turn-helix domain-containing protein [Azospirillum sp. TSO35-2]PWC32895.1 hypothetical protein TSO352_20070 [Azospirillum sp. TSO35-2]